MEGFHGFQKEKWGVWMFLNRLPRGRGAAQLAMRPTRTNHASSSPTPSRGRQRPRHEMVMTMTIKMGSTESTAIKFGNSVCYSHPSPDFSVGSHHRDALSGRAGAMSWSTRPDPDEGIGMPNWPISRRFNATQRTSAQSSAMHHLSASHLVLTVQSGQPPPVAILIWFVR